MVTKLEVEEEIEVILDALLRGQSPPFSEFYRLLNSVLKRAQEDSHLYSCEQLLSLQSVLSRLMVSYAEEVNSKLLHPTRGEVSGFAAIRTQLDLMISLHEVVKEGEEFEPLPCPVGSLIPLKKKSVRNIVITSGC